MEKNFVSNRDESLRLFNNRLLDKLSYVHWSYPLIFWIPIICYCGYSALKARPVGSLAIPAAFLGGVAFWTLSEYLLHRFVFHYEPSTEWGKRLHFLIHGVHHDYPNDSKRLVMPPLLAAIFVTPFYLLFRIVLGDGAVFYAFLAGFLVGYLVYDMTHYAVHHAKLSHPLWISLKQHHFVHHYQDPNHGFGVSSKLWDIVFHTMFKRDGEQLRDPR
jgi:sterol desaturase/sphingolipid hydroxylase (fatty acid hydroxylase superfamily)